jgi:hypothetical protein
MQWVTMSKITDKLKEKVKDVKDKLVETKDKVTDTTKDTRKELDWRLRPLKQTQLILMQK